MKAVCVKSYYDKQLKRKVTVGDELELIDDRFKELSTTSNDAKMTLVKAKPEKKATVKKDKVILNISLLRVTERTKHPQGCYFLPFL